MGYWVLQQCCHSFVSKTVLITTFLKWTNLDDLIFNQSNVNFSHHFETVFLISIVIWVINASNTRIFVVFLIVSFFLFIYIWHEYVSVIIENQLFVWFLCFLCLFPTMTTSYLYLFHQIITIDLFITQFIDYIFVNIMWRHNLNYPIEFLDFTRKLLEFFLMFLQTFPKVFYYFTYSLPRNHVFFYCQISQKSYVSTEIMNTLMEMDLHTATA